jgi:hypothetical protein
MIERFDRLGVHPAPAGGAHHGLLETFDYMVDQQIAYARKEANVRRTEGMRKSSVPVLLALVLALSSSLAPPSAGAAPPRPDSFRDFAAACSEAFDRATPGEGTSQAGHDICDCTAKESRKSKVTAKEIGQETARLRKDSKVKIDNPKILGALQSCSIDVLQGASH